MPYRPIIIAALQAAVLCVAGLRIPVLGQIALIFVPVPLIAAAVLHGRTAGLASTALATLLLAVFMPWQTAILLFLLGFGLMAAGLSEGMLRGLRPETAIALGSILPLIAVIAAFTPALLHAGQDPVTMIGDFLRKSIQEAQKLYTDIGAVDLAQAIGAAGDTIIFYVLRLLPGIILATTVMQAAGCYGIARSLVLRRRPDLAAGGPLLPVWHAPDGWVWVLIAALAAIAIAPRGTATWFAGLNVSLLFLFVYTAQGVAVMEFYYRKARLPIVMRSFLHAVILALPSVVAVVALGVVDIWADFRKLRPSPGTGPGGH
jgi:uncharacterized protein YybS (DUF2232 family)